MIQFIDIDAQAIKDGIKADYEALTGRILQPGQVEQLLINAFAYREYLLRININDAANQNLVAFSRAPFLDYLGELVGVRRLEASKASSTVKLTFETGHGNLIVPAGIRIQSLDGLSIFTLDEALTVSSSIDEITGTATATQAGKDSNDIAAGDLAIILDPQPYLISIENTEATVGGSDRETDDELRERIRMAPQSFSNAGSRGAYIFFAKSANSGIADVSVTSDTPGTVQIYVLMKDGELPNNAILDEVSAVCNSEKVRPLTDTVTVMAPSVIHYDIEIDLTLITGSVSSEIQDAVEKSLKEYTDNRQSKCGLDVVKEAIIKRGMIEGVYSVAVVQPLATLLVAPNEVAKVGNITVNVVGYSDE